MATVHLRSNGYYRFSLGHVVVDGKRVQKHFSLGKDRKTAQQLSNHIELVWLDETATDGNGLRIWSEAGLQAAQSPSAQPPVAPAPEPPSNPQPSAIAASSKPVFALQPYTPSNIDPRS